MKNGKGNSLHSLFLKELAEVPRMLVTDFVRNKLATTEHQDNEYVIGVIVEKLLLAENSKSEENGLREEEIDLTVEFTNEDADHLARQVDKLVNNLPNMIRDVAKEAARKMLHRYERDWIEWRPVSVLQMDQFRVNLEARWGKGFDSLRMLIELSRDIGTEFHKRIRKSRSQKQVHLNSSIMNLHIRALQISSEIMVLIENGYADGAMARWRTLHEVTCVAMVLKDGGNALAERYLAHEIVEARKGLLQYEKCSPRLGFKPFSKREARRIEREYDSALKLFGKSFGGDYGWAANYLGNSKPNFSHVEEAAGRAMMRSHYKLASQNIHATTKGITYRLGSLGNRCGVIAGASNVGFVEPGQNLALSLLHITMLLLPDRWTLDRIAQLTALTMLQERIPRALARSENAIENDEKALRERAALRRVRQKIIFSV